MPKLSIRDLELADKRVLIRVDYNVPMKDGKVTDDTRIRETLKTLEYLLLLRALRSLLVAHLGRPKGKPVESMSLRPVARRLRVLLDQVFNESENVAFSPDCVGEIAKEMARELESGQTLLLENLRFHPEEEANDPRLRRPARRALRPLRGRRLRQRAPRPRLHRGHHPLRGAIGRRPADGEGVELPGQGAHRAGPAIRRHHRRIEDLGQDRRDRQPAGQGRHAADRRRHGLHLSRRAGPEHRQVADRGRQDRRRQARRWRRPRPGASSCCCPSTMCWPTSSPPTPRRRSSVARERSPPTGWGWTSAQRRSISLPRRSPTRAPFCGTGRWASSSLRRSRTERMRLQNWWRPTATPPASWAAEIRSPRSSRPELRTRSPTSPPAAAPSLEFLEGKTLPGVAALTDK